MCNFDHCIEYKLYFRYCLKKVLKSVERTDIWEDTKNY